MPMRWLMRTCISASALFQRKGERNFGRNTNIHGNAKRHGYSICYNRRYYIHIRTRYCCAISQSKTRKTHIRCLHPVHVFFLGVVWFIGVGRFGKRVSEEQRIREFASICYHARRHRFRSRFAFFGRVIWLTALTAILFLASDNDPKAYERPAYARLFP